MHLATSLAQHVASVTRMIIGAMLMSIMIPDMAQGVDRPNVIVIMADDLGAEALGCYGSTVYTTPNLDRMADEGMRFNNA